MSNTDRQILRGMLTVALFAILGRIAGAAKEMAIAWRFGVSNEVDGYMFANNLVALPAALLFSVLSATMIPLVVGWPQRWGDKLAAFASQLIVFTIVLGVVGLAFAAWAVPSLIGSQALGMPAASAAAALIVSDLLIWAVPAGLISSLAAAWLLAANRHINTLFEALPALIILGCVLLFAKDIVALAWATVIGAGIHALVLVVTLKFLPRERLHPPAPGAALWGIFLGSLGIAVAAQILMLLTNLIDQFFAARLAAGSLSILGYANRIASLALAVCAMSISRATLPVLSALSATDAKARAVIRRWAIGIFGVGTLACLIGAFLARPAVRLLFERGAFTESDTVAVADILRVLLLQLPPYCAGLVLVSWAIAARRLRLIFFASLAAFCVKVIVTHFLISIFGLAGIALATAMMYTTTLAVLWWGFATNHRREGS